MGMNTWAKARGHDLANTTGPLRKEQTKWLQVDFGGSGVSWGPTAKGLIALQGGRFCGGGGTLHQKPSDCRTADGWEGEGEGDAGFTASFPGWPPAATGLQEG